MTGYNDRRPAFLWAAVASLANLGTDGSTRSPCGATGGFLVSSTLWRAFAARVAPLSCGPGCAFSRKEEGGRR